ncbi:hypothetical protein G4V62_00835 [Bacillaceae bacterium SIJ1]|nr:type II secretion system F family protein [Litoribacterium kuwaitense]NGP43574.1 hypothetical protein [Litoribacterium kuwaitense]
MDKGYSMQDALVHLQAYFGPKYEKSFTEMLLKLSQGVSFSDALHHLGFHAHVLSFFKMPHSQKSFPDLLKQSGEMLAGWATYRHQFYRILRYPIMMTIGMLLFLICLKIYILPLFQGITQEKSAWFATALPDVLLIVIQVLFIAFLLTVLLVFSLQRWASPHVRTTLYLRIPLVKQWLRYYYTYFLSTQLSTLFSSGCSAKEAFSLLSKTSSSAFLKIESHRIYDCLESGETLIVAIKKSDCYDPSLPAIISMGQLNSDLSKQLFELGESMASRMNDMMKSIVQRTQPILLLTLGCFIFVLFLSVMLPVFQMMSDI